MKPWAHVGPAGPQVLTPRATCNQRHPWPETPCPGREHRVGCAPRVQASPLMSADQARPGSDDVGILELVGPGTLERLLALVATRPIGRPLLATRAARWEDPALLAGYALARIAFCLRGGDAQDGPISPPCSWCGELTRACCTVAGCNAGGRQFPVAVCPVCADRFDAQCPAHRFDSQWLANRGRRADP